MADREISDLTLVNTMNATDWLHVKQNSADVRVVPDTLFALHCPAGTSNPHNVTKATVELGNVTNDAQLKIASNLADLASAATARTNLDVMSSAEVAAAIAVHASRTDDPHNVTKDQVGLANVQNYVISHSPDDNYTDRYASSASVNVVRQQVNTLGFAAVPVGAIMFWPYNSVTNPIPLRWKPLYGPTENGTPIDLRGKFIRCGDNATVGDFGGADTVSHTHSGSTGGFALTEEHIPPHRHNCPVGFYDGQYGYSGGSGGRATYNNPEDDTGYHARTSTSTGAEFGLEGQAHSHSATIDYSTTNNLPSYYTLIPIIYTGVL